MSGKNEKNKSRKQSSTKIVWVVTLVVAVLLAAGAFLLTQGDKKTPEKSEAVADATAETQAEVQLDQVQPVGIPLKDGIALLDVGSYTGAFVEDGSNEVVSGVLMLRVVNNGEDAVEYARITMQVGEETAEFSVSTLLPGASVVLLEKNRMAYDHAFDYASAETVCDTVAIFKEPLSLHEDKLKIQILDQAINVTNISNEDITGKIRIFYKNAAADVYYGGITYTVSMEEGLKAGEVRQIMTNHASDTGSKIMFVRILP